MFNDADVSSVEPPSSHLSNTVKNGKCQNCDSQQVEEFLCCLFCKVKVHMNGCFDDSDDDILSNSDAKSFYKAINKIGKFAHRPGNFRFVCDPCLTNFESKQTCTTNDSVQILDKRVTDLSEDITTIKEMLKTITTSADKADNPQVYTSVADSYHPGTNGNINVWQDKDRVKSLLVVNKEVDLQNMDIQKSVTDKGLQVSGQYVNKKGENVFVLPSQSAREKLKNELVASGISCDKLAEPKQRYPAISVVGIPNNFDKDSKSDLLDTILKQNPMIADLVNANNSVFEILIIKPIRKNENIKQAIVRVGDNIRYAIKNSGDKLFCGMSCCKVYDQLYIKRCNKCQDFGHYAKECSGVAFCGICGSEHHETTSCTHKENPREDILCCVNCKKAGVENVKHLASSVSCPTYLARQEKMKSTISYYNVSKN